MNNNTDYYQRNAEEFFQGTVGVDMGPLRARFLANLPARACILDAGCGSGRDAKAFADLGHGVTAFDASHALAQRASEHCGFEVAVRTFDAVDEVDAYDGIWCCASLLHVPVADMPTVLAALWRALRAGGCLYLSFKLGHGERNDRGRRFTDANESTVRTWLSALPQLNGMDYWVTADQRPGREERWINALARRASDDGKRLVTGGKDHFLPHLSQAMARATDVDIAVAFTKVSGLRLLMPDLQASLSTMVPESHPVSPRRMRFMTSDYLGVTDPQALRLLQILQAQGADVRVYTTGSASFHLKAYLFARTVDGRLVEGTAFIGSSNISRQALQDGLEWNYRVVYPGDRGFLEARQRFVELFDDPRSATLTDAWIESYERRRIPPLKTIAPGSDEQEPVPAPTRIQQDALDALARTRADGYRRGLVVLATGLGKTWLAAFDSERFGARRVLFVAHREEILAQAAATFVRIRPRAKVGFYMGQTRDMQVDVLCASVQTLGRAEHLDRFDAGHFDYIVVDEFHHAAAATYRRLLKYFAPAFLLGLTATPDRTDQSDICSLCDDNLVHTCDLFEGIESQLLAPFHYHGIHDESVDYRELPWRSGRFDPEQLANKLATLARARHALREWRVRAQSRTLAFCVSRQHADFMADQFVKAGVSAAAVYTGSVLGRAQALEQLNDGGLKVVFSVDLFNEGVDLPSIDTIMMLRPTESKILFLQQLGRGLRRSDGKTHLVALDFIGNHQSFFHKPQALFQIGSTYRDMADFARRAERHELELPEGCFVNYDLQIIDFLKSLDATGPTKDYEALKASLGRRPTALEFHRAGASLQAARRQFGSWFELVASADDLMPHEKPVVSRNRDFLREVEVTAMTRSFKMVLLEALLELDGFRAAPTLVELAARSREVLQRRHELLSDLPAEMRTEEEGRSIAWQRYWRDNPVNAWTGGNSKAAGRAWFRVEEERLVFTGHTEFDDRDTLDALVQELVDYRLASYQARLPESASGNVVPIRPKVDRSSELAYFPNLKIACGHFRAGRADAEEHRTLPAAYGLLDPARHFIARASGNSMTGGKNSVQDGDYLLLELLGPSHAGSITGSVMAIERQDEAGGDNQYLLRVVTKTHDGQYVLRANNPDYADLPATDDMRTLARLKSIIEPLDLAVGQEFMREAIPPLFGESFNPGSWNSGHVTLNEKKVHVLLVTLNKQGKATEHRYLDRWVDERTFQWQSQNATTPSSKRGQEIIRHAELGIDLHLFIREAKLRGGTAAPFVYHGKATYVSHMGSAPMSVTFSV